MIYFLYYLFILDFFVCNYPLVMILNEEIVSILKSTFIKIVILIKYISSNHIK